MSWFYHDLTKEAVLAIFHGGTPQGDFIIHTRDDENGVYALEVMGPQKVSSHLITRRTNNTFLIDGQSTGGSTDLCQVVAYLSKPGKDWPVVLREGLDKHGFTKGNRALLDFDSTLDEPSADEATGGEGADSGGHHARVVEVAITKQAGKYFGLNLEELPDGMKIAEVLPGGLAAQEGQIMAGMLLVNINGQPVAGKDKREITNVLRALRGKTRLGVSHAPAEVPKPEEVELLSTKDFLNMGLDFVSAADSSLAPKRDLCGTVVVSGRIGYASFINGHYDSVLQFIGGRPTYKCAHRIQNTEEYKYGQNVGKPLFLFYHSTNECWVISQILGGDHIIAYCDGEMGRPELLEDVWHVAGATGDFEADGGVACSPARQTISKFRATFRSLPGVEFAHDLKELEIADICTELRCPTTIVAQLRLDKNNLSRKSLKQLCEAFNHNMSIRELTICNNQIDDEGAMLIAEAMRMHPNIEILSLRGNEIEDSGAQQLAIMLKYTDKLQGLRLTKNNITEVGAAALVEALADNKDSGMVALELSQNNIAPKKMAKIQSKAKKLQKRSPPCFVTFDEQGGSTATFTVLSK